MKHSMHTFSTIGTVFKSFLLIFLFSLLVSVLALPLYLLVLNIEVNFFELFLFSLIPIAYIAVPISLPLSLLVNFKSKAVRIASILLLFFIIYIVVKLVEYVLGFEDFNH